MSTDFQNFLANMSSSKPVDLAGQVRAFLKNIEPKDQDSDDDNPVIAHLVSGGPVPLKVKVWRKLDQKVFDFNAMAKEDWPTNCPAPSEQLEVAGLVLKKKLAGYVDMQEIFNPVELTTAADAVQKAGKTLEDVMVLLGKFNEEVKAAKVAEAAFVKTLS